MSASPDAQLEDFGERVGKMMKSDPGLERDDVKLEGGCMVIYKDHVQGLSLARAAMTDAELAYFDEPRKGLELLNSNYVDRVCGECETYASAWQKRCAAIEEAREPIQLPALPDSPAGKSDYEAWLDQTLLAHDCIVVTERHDNAGAADFLMDNMQTFAADQRVVLTEYLFVEWQPAIDAFMAATTPDEENKCLAPLGLVSLKDEKRLGVIRQAKIHKVGLLGIDSALASTVRGDDTDEGFAKRAAAMNEVALRVHEEHVDGKSIIHTGVAHGKHTAFKDGTGVPGLSHVLGAPVVYCTQEAPPIQGSGYNAMKPPQFTFSETGHFKEEDGLSQAYDLSIHRIDGNWRAFPARLDPSSSSEETYVDSDADADADAGTDNEDSNDRLKASSSSESRD